MAVFSEIASTLYLTANSFSHSFSDDLAPSSDKHTDLYFVAGSEPFACNWSMTLQGNPFQARFPPALLIERIKLEECENRFFQLLCIEIHKAPHKYGEPFFRTLHSYSLAVIASRNCT